MSDNKDKDKKRLSALGFTKKHRSRTATLGSSPQSTSPVGSFPGIPLRTAPPTDATQQQPQPQQQQPQQPQQLPTLLVTSTTSLSSVSASSAPISSSISASAVPASHTTATTTSTSTTSTSSNNTQTPTISSSVSLPISTSNAINRSEQDSLESSSPFPGIRLHKVQESSSTAIGPSTPTHPTASLSAALSPHSTIPRSASIDGSIADLPIMSARDRERDEADKRRAIRIEADLREYEEQLKEKREALKKIHEAELYARKRVQQLERKEQDLIRSLNSIERIESASVPSEVPMSAREKKNNKSSSSSSSSSSTASVVDTRARQSAWLSELSEDSIIIGKRLGSGGSGATVHNCLVDGWACAVKMLNHRFCGLHQSESFEREMALLYRMPPHRNIIRYLFHRELNGIMCLFMTKHDLTLSEYIASVRENNSFIPMERVIDYAKQISSGLAFLHTHQIVHRDIKSENIFATMGPDTLDPHPKLLVIADFDTAKRIGLAERPTSTIGTAGFMAPEVYMAKEVKKSYSFAADIYSFGMVLYELMTLRTPYEELPKVWDIYTAVETGQRPLMLPEEIARYDEQLVTLYHQCINYNPDERPSLYSIMRVLNALDKRELEIQAPVPMPVSSPQTTKSRSQSSGNIFRQGKVKKRERAAPTVSDDNEGVEGTSSDDSSSSLPIGDVITRSASPSANSPTTLDLSRPLLVRVWLEEEKTSRVFSLPATSSGADVMSALLNKRCREMHGVITPETLALVTEHYKSYRLFRKANESDEEAPYDVGDSVATYRTHIVTFRKTGEAFSDDLSCPSTDDEGSASLTSSTPPNSADTILTDAV